ncbi:hypothetical protein, partial [Clostridioides difficile]|uniref:hypothetical protein n=1 Tax=Clostridioides difficile TaxID=1496 RepID=UPI001A9BAD2C
FVASKFSAVTFPTSLVTSAIFSSAFVFASFLACDYSYAATAPCTFAISSYPAKLVSYTPLTLPTFSPV